MLYKKIQLTEDEDVFLEAFAADKVGDFVRDGLLVIPGGGYKNVCADREGEPIAQAFMPYGFNAFVLHYTVDRKKPYPAQLIEASLAMKHIKDNAAEYNVNPERVFTVGFSAGGHLAGSLGTMWHRREVYEAASMPYGYNKPTGMMLIYPVLNDHTGSFCNLLCNDNPSKEELDYVDVVANTDEKTVSAFIMHGCNDTTVPVKNSIDMAAALTALNIPCELHIYPDATHGIALANEITYMGWSGAINPTVAKWVENAAAWTKNFK